MAIVQNTPTKDQIADEPTKCHTSKATGTAAVAALARTLLVEHVRIY